MLRMPQWARGQSAAAEVLGGLECLAQILVIMD
jgi:hypothetical protein